MKRIGLWRSASASALLSFLFFAVPVLSADQTIQFNVSQQSATTGIPEFARQAGIQILVSEELVRGKRTVTVIGPYTVRDGLELLLSTTGLAISSKDEKTFTLGPPARPSQNLPPVLQPSNSENSASRAKERRPLSADEENASLSEIVVTGTYLHHTDAITPLITLTQDEMVKQGYTTLTQVFDQLPQNFKFGASPESTSANGEGGGAAAQNYTFATGVNLRGLGTAATLVLLNGRRVAQTVYGGIVDVSQIPVSIIDHVDILTDGASALYGSDAVAGVVNIVTKKDFSGFQVGGRVNSIAPGKTPNDGGNLLGGYSWSGGNITANLDYEKDNPLAADKRAASLLVPQPFDLLPKSESANLYVSLQNKFTDQLSLSTDALATKKTFSQTATLAAGYPPGHNFGNTTQYNISSELSYRVSTEWTALLIAQGSEEIEKQLSKDSAGDYQGYQYPVEYKVYSLESRVDGPLFQAPGGASRAAFGVQFRHEAFNFDNFNSDGTQHFGSARHISSVYGELQVPLIGNDNAMPLAQRLRIDLSGRYDKYSDFGRTTNPKVAAEWVPVQGLALHASYSRSFQAPSLYLSSNAINQGLAYAFTDPSSSTGTTNGLYVDGTNPGLQPETSKNYTFGVTYEPAFVGGLKLDANFYSIDFTNEITHLVNLYSATWIQQAAQLGSFVVLNPTAAQVEQALSNPPGRTVYNLIGGFCIVGQAGCTLDPALIKALGYLGYENAASVTIKGVDFSAHYAGQPTQFGRFRTDMDGTYFTTYRQRVAPSAVETSLQNTVYNPLRFRAKANVGWDWSYWGANARINYANSFDNTVDPNCSATGTCRVSSWTTIDLSFAYTSAPATGLRVGLDITNLFDRAPPFLSSPPGSLNFPYDSTNSNPFGRMIGINFTKTWRAH